MKQPTNEQIQATNKAYELRKYLKNDTELSKILKLSKVTLYTRLKESNWTNPEILWIEYVYNERLNQFVESLKILNDEKTNKTNISNN